MNKLFFNSNNQKIYSTFAYFSLAIILSNCSQSKFIDDPSSNSQKLEVNSNLMSSSNFRDSQLNSPSIELDRNTTATANNSINSVAQASVITSNSNTTSTVRPTSVNTSNTYVAPTSNTVSNTNTTNSNPYSTSPINPIREPAPSTSMTSDPNCSPQELGYALCPLRPARLPNGTLSQSTALAAYGRSRIVASAGNFVVVKEGKNGLTLRAVDKSGVLVGNGANLFSPASVVRLVILTGLIKSSDLKEKIMSLTHQLDAANIGYKPYKAIPNSDAGTDFEGLFAGKLGAAYDWTSDRLANCKGTSALGSLKRNQVTAALVGLRGANSSLLGKKVPEHVRQALGNGVGGVVCYDLSTIEGLNNSMLTQSSGIKGILSQDDIDEYMKHKTSIDLSETDYYPL